MHQTSCIGSGTVSRGSLRLRLTSLCATPGRQGAEARALVIDLHVVAVVAITALPVQADATERVTECHVAASTETVLSFYLSCSAASAAGALPGRHGSTP